MPSRTICLARRAFEAVCSSGVLQVFLILFLEVFAVLGAAMITLEYGHLGQIEC